MAQQYPLGRYALLDSDQLEAQQDALRTQLQQQALGQFGQSMQGSVEQPQVGSQQPEKSLKDLLEEQMKLGMNRRQQDVELARALHQEQLKQPVQVDLSNFFGMANAAGADPRLATYKAPVNYDAMKAQELINQEEQGLTKDQIAYLKEQLEAQARDKELARQSRFDRDKNMSAFKYVKSAYDQPIKDISDFNTSISGVKSALATGKTFDVQTALSQFARAMGEKGVLTDEDIKRVMPDNLKVRYAKFMSFIKANPDEPFPQEVLDAMRNRLGDLEETARKKLAQRIDEQDEQFLSAPNEFGQYAGKMSVVAKKRLGEAKQTKQEQPPGGKKILSPEEYFKQKS